MALNYNLTNQEIKDTFQQLAQVSGSIATNQGQASGSAILDGSGSLVENLHATSSHAISSSFADLAKSATTTVSASHAVIADSSLTSLNANTASFFGEGMVTASAVASTITFTKDNGTTFDVTVAQSGSVQSASYAAFASNAHSASYAVSASSAIYTVSSSYSIKATSADTATSALTATSASHAVQANNALTATSASHAGYANNSTSASYAVSASHSEFADLAQLANSSTTSISASYSTKAGLADNATSAVTSSHAISALSASHAIRANNADLATLATSATSASHSERSDFAGTADSATSASHSEFADLAELANNATAAVSSSYALSSSVVNDPNVAYINKNNVFGGTQTFNDITVNGTGSFAYISSVTGSQKIIGESFIVLQNDTPALRYAGIKVYDSGSTAATASIEWDGLTDNWIIAEESGNTGVVLTGVTGSRGSEALPTVNVLQKGAGHHSLTNSAITDDGVGVTVSTAVTSSKGFSSTGFNQASKFNGDVSAFSLTTTGEVLAKSSFSTTAGMTIGEATAPKRLGYYTVHSNAGKWSDTGNAAGLYIIDQSGSDAFVGQIGNFSNPFEENNSGSFIVQGGANADSPFQNTIMYANEANGFPHFVKSTYFDKPVIVSSSLEVTGSLNVNGALTPSSISTGDIAAANIVASTAVTSSNGFSSTGFNKASNFNGAIQAFSIGTTGAITLQASFSTVKALNFGEAAGPVGTVGTSNYFTSASSAGGAVRYYGQYIIDTDQADSFVGNFVNLGSLDTANNTAFVIQGGANADATYVNTIMSANQTDGIPKFQKSTVFQKALRVEGITTLSGSVVTSGSVATEVISGSHNGSNFTVDMDLGNMFTVELKSGSNIVIEAGNIKKGGTAMLEVKQPTASGAFGTIDFADAYKFTDGTHPQATQASGSVDVLTFTSFDGTTLAGTSVLNLK